VNVTATAVLVAGERGPHWHGTLLESGMDPGSVGAVVGSLDMF